MTLIADIIHDITANPAPVLFLDTCILLDVVRAPLRSKPDEVRFAQLFLAHPAFRGVGVTSSSISAPSNALPRFRTL